MRQYIFSFLAQSKKICIKRLKLHPIRDLRYLSKLRTLSFFRSGTNYGKNNPDYFIIRNIRETKWVIRITNNIFDDFQTFS